MPTSPRPSDQRRVTSPEVSTLASHYMQITERHIRDAAINGGAVQMAADMRTMAASLLSQDEEPGQ